MDNGLYNSQICKYFSLSNLKVKLCTIVYAAHRNIVEGVYGDTLSQRREAISSEDAALIRSFSKAAVRRPVDNRPYFMIGGLLLLGALCIVLVRDLPFFNLMFIVVCRCY